MNIYATIKEKLSFNDDVGVFYYLIMALFMFSPSLFFVSDFSYVKSIALFYVMGVLFLYGTKNITRMDLSENWFSYIFYGGISALLFWLFIPVATNQLGLFNSNLSAFLWYVFAVGLSETFMMLGVRKLLKNELYALVVMALLHVTSYMILLGSYSFNSVLVSKLFVSAIGFWIFFKIYDKTQKPFVVALIHGLFDIFILGGFF